MKYIGIDGCKGGWFYVWLDDRQAHGCGILETIDALTVLVNSTDTALIDMPIGLKESGFHERQHILSRYTPSCEAIITRAKNRFLRRQAGVDDILDALCGAVSASFRDHFIFLPTIPETDPRGLTMQIV